MEVNQYTTISQELGHLQGWGLHITQHFYSQQPIRWSCLSALFYYAADENNLPSPYLPLWMQLWSIAGTRCPWLLLPELPSHSLPYLQKQQLASPQHFLACFLMLLVDFVLPLSRTDILLSTCACIEVQHIEICGNHSCWQTRWWAQLKKGIDRCIHSFVSCSYCVKY